MNQGFINYNYIDFKILWIDSFGRGVSHTLERNGRMRYAPTVINSSQSILFNHRIQYLNNCQLARRCIV